MMTVSIQYRSLRDLAYTHKSVAHGSALLLTCLLPSFLFLSHGQLCRCRQCSTPTYYACCTFRGPLLTTSILRRALRHVCLNKRARATFMPASANNELVPCEPFEL